MTPAEREQQRKQQARDFISSHNMNEFDETTHDLTQLLADTEAAALRKVESEIAWLWEEGQISQSARDMVLDRLAKEARG